MDGLRQVLVVGGRDENTYIRTSLAKKLHSVGLLVSWIWDGDATGERVIPQSCDLVLLLHDNASHSKLESVIAAANRQRVKWTRISYKWAIAQEQLLERGIITKEDLEQAPKHINGEIREIEPPQTPFDEPEPERPQPVTAQWSAEGKPRDEILRVLRNVIAELITGHNACNIRISDTGRITMDIRESLDLNDLLAEKD